MSIVYPTASVAYMSTSRINSRGVITKRKVKIPAPLADTSSNVKIAKPFLSPTLPSNSRCRKLEQFFGDRILVDNPPPKASTAGFHAITQSWIPLCYFIRFAYSRNHLQNLLCYLELDRILSSYTNNQLEFIKQSETLIGRFFEPVQRIKLTKELSFKNKYTTRTSREYRSFFNEVKSYLAEFFTDFYFYFEKDRLYAEMIRDLDSNFGLLSDLKLKALRQLDSELGIFTYNFEELPNVDLLYQFRKNVLMVQPNISMSSPTKGDKVNPPRCVSPNPYQNKQKEKAFPGKFEYDLQIKTSLYDKLDSLKSNFNGKEGYTRLEQ